MVTVDETPINDIHGYLPSRVQIESECQRIQAEWTEEDRRKRSGLTKGDRQLYSPKIYRCLILGIAKQRHKWIDESDNR